MMARGALRGLFARKDGQDVGYLLGGVFHDTFRGLQFSYDARLAHLSLGNLMQVEMVSRLEGQGLSWYDLGSEVEYKKQWGEAGLETLMFVVVA
jgi:CelD/BcsL family acetyltransferase involved in cellulose biosynthesis